MPFVTKTHVFLLWWTAMYDETTYNGTENRIEKKIWWPRAYTGTGMCCEITTSAIVLVFKLVWYGKSLLNICSSLIWIPNLCDDVDLLWMYTYTCMHACLWNFYVLIWMHVFIYVMYVRVYLVFIHALHIFMYVWERIRIETGKRIRIETGLHDYEHFNNSIYFCPYVWCVHKTCTTFVYICMYMLCIHIHV
jgi:hypothetical protein